MTRDGASGALVGLVVVLLVAAALGALIAVTLRGSEGMRDACPLAAPSGRALDVAFEDSGVEDAGDGARRVVTYELDAARFSATDVRACSEVGDVDVVASGDGRARVVFTLASGGLGDRDAVRDTAVEARFAEDDDTLSLAAGPTRLPSFPWSVFGRRPVEVDVRVELPADATHEVEATTDVGAVTAQGLRLAGAQLKADVGDVRLLDADARGAVSLETDVGAVTARLGGVGNGTLTAAADVGDVTLRLPGGAGFDAVAAVDVGTVEVDLGPTERYVEDDEGPGDRVEATTEGYGGAGTRVVVRATADVGDVRVTRG